MNDNNAVMNVMPHIECGTKPKLNLIVKNNPSALDPVYTQVIQINPNQHVIAGIPQNSANLGHIVSHNSINVDGKSHHFTYNSAIACQTAGNQSFYSCFEICLDHKFHLAKNSLNQRIVQGTAPGQTAPLPTRCTHTIVSNYTDVNRYNLLVTPTHVDPIINKRRKDLLRYGSTMLASEEMKHKEYPFGGVLEKTTFEAYKCDPLPSYFYQPVMTHNDPPRSHDEAIKEKSTVNMPVEPIREPLVAAKPERKPKLSRTNRIGLGEYRDKTAQASTSTSLLAKAINPENPQTVVVKTPTKVQTPPQTSQQASQPAPTVISKTEAASKVQTTGASEDEQKRTTTPRK
jgi:hypothetical protein